MKTHSTLLLLAASIISAGCQTTEVVPTKTTPQYENIRTMQADSDLDDDGVLDAIDECPETPPNVVVDAKGCPVVVYTGSLELQLQGFFDIPVDHLYARPLMVEAVKKGGFKNGIVVAPDIGSVKIARSYAEELSTDFAIVDKGDLIDMHEQAQVLIDMLCRSWRRSMTKSLTPIAWCC